MSNLPVKTESVLPAAQEWRIMKELSTDLLKSGFLPKSIRTPEQAIAIMLKGKELGIPPMQALSQISIVQGKPTLEAQLMLSQIYKKVPGAKIEFSTMNASECVILAARSSDDTMTEFSFTMEDAKLMGLAGKDNWKKMPKVMLKWRCVSEMARTMFPDALSGAAYTVEEMSPDSKVDENGDVIDVVTDPPDPEEEWAFDMDDPEHQNLLMEYLKRKGVPDAHWEEAGRKLIGKGKDQFKGVADYYINIEKLKTE